MNRVEESIKADELRERQARIQQAIETLAQVIMRIRGDDVGMELQIFGDGSSMIEDGNVRCIQNFNTPAEAAIVLSKT